MSLATAFGVQDRVRRSDYLAWGWGLAVLKLAIDTAIVYSFKGLTWSFWGYLLPSLLVREARVGETPEAMHLALVAAALPFLWVGVTMSVRRAADAGWTPWFGTLFLFPILNYAVILALSIKPSKAPDSWRWPASSAYRAPAGGRAPESTALLSDSLRATLLSLLASFAVGLSMLLVGIYGLRTYGFALFFGTPFAMGALSAVIQNKRARRSLVTTIFVALASMMLTGLCTLFFAIEGLLCLGMALPIACVIAVLGAIIGWAIVNATRFATTPSAATMLVVLPALAVGEAKLVEPTRREVTTTLEIDAPPERVWPNVVGFSELPRPPELIYRLGIAYPMRARIDGSGVGAIRRCEFSTGAFVEPITVWDAPRRLAFDVIEQPPSMTELSPYQHIHAPHVEGYMTSKGGEFRLIPLPGGRTRVEGTTYYTMSIYPEAYWVVYAELLLHGIHRRVLEHVKRLSETEPM